MKDMKNEDLQVGSVVLMTKNEDGTFSPLMMDKDHAYIIHHFLCGLSEDRPLAKLSDKYAKL